MLPLVTSKFPSFFTSHKCAVSIYCKHLHACHFDTKFCYSLEFSPSLHVSRRVQLTFDDHRIDLAISGSGHMIITLIMLSKSAWPCKANVCVICWRSYEIVKISRWLKPHGLYLCNDEFWVSLMIIASISPTDSSHLMLMAVLNKIDDVGCCESDDSDYVN